MAKTQAGNDFQARVMGDPSSNGTGLYASACFIALSETNTATTGAETTLVGELTGFGFQRKTVGAGYSHTAGAASYVLSTTFTSTDATTRTIATDGVFNAISAGTLVFRSQVPSPPVLVSGDQIIPTVSVAI